MSIKACNKQKDSDHYLLSYTLLFVWNLYKASLLDI